VNGWRVRLGWVCGALLCGAALVAGCEGADRSLGYTSERDYALILQVPDRYLCVGDQAPITVRLRRADRSNLSRGLHGRIYLTLSAHGTVDATSLDFAVTDDVTSEVIDTVIYTAAEPGLAEIRATFLDATAKVEIVISAIVP